MNTIVRFCGASLALTSSLALADHTNSEGYFGGSANVYQYSIPQNDSFSTSDFDLSSIELQAGYSFNKLGAFEVRVGHGVGDESFDYTGGSGTLQLNEYAAVYLRPQFPIGPVQIYGLLGYSYSKLRLRTTDDISSSTSSNGETDFSYGAGLDVKLGQHWNLFGEYKVLYDDTGFDLSGAGIGVNFRY